MASAQTPPSRAAALGLGGKAEIRLGEIAAARVTLAEALVLDPHNKDACKQLAALDFPANDADAVVALSDALTARGAAHARLFAACQAHVAGFAPADHPWADARPDQALLRSWCVITESEGFETWHVHQFGWLSGAYYVRVPESITGGEGEGGCIAFGLPEDLAGEAGAAAYGLRLVRPRSGLLLLFPSHTYHRTFPHGVQDQRICVAFDIKPRASCRGASIRRERWRAGPCARARNRMTVT